MVKISFYSKNCGKFPNILWKLQACPWAAQSLVCCDVSRLWGHQCWQYWKEGLTESGGKLCVRQVHSHLSHYCTRCHHRWGTWDQLHCEWSQDCSCQAELHCHGASAPLPPLPPRHHSLAQTKLLTLIWCSHAVNILCAKFFK